MSQKDNSELIKFFDDNKHMIMKYLKYFNDDIEYDILNIDNSIKAFVNMEDTELDELFKYTIDKYEDSEKLLEDSDSYINKLNLDIEKKKKIIFFYTFFRNLIDINKFNADELNANFNYDFNYDVYKNITNEEFFSLDYHYDNIVYEDDEKIIYKSTITNIDEKYKEDPDDELKKYLHKLILINKFN